MNNAEAWLKEPTCHLCGEPILGNIWHVCYPPRDGNGRIIKEFSDNNKDLTDKLIMQDKIDALLKEIDTLIEVAEGDGLKYSQLEHARKLVFNIRNSQIVLP